MNDDDPVSVWIEQLRTADESAARGVWEHFAARLCAMARAKLHSDTRKVYDEEDAALSMFRSVCEGMATGRFPELHDRNSLWGLMLVMTTQKISNRHRFDRQQRRDIRRTVTDSVFDYLDRSVIDIGGTSMASREPTPEFAAEFAETCQTLFDALRDPLLEQVVLLKMEGMTDAEIAAKTDCSRRTVKRRLEIIRRQLIGMELLNE